MYSCKYVNFLNYISKTLAFDCSFSKFVCSKYRCDEPVVEQDSDDDDDDNDDEKEIDYPC